MIDKKKPLISQRLLFQIQSQFLRPTKDTELHFYHKPKRNKTKPFQTDDRIALEQVFIVSQNLKKSRFTLNVTSKKHSQAV